MKLQRLFLIIIAAIVTVIPEMKAHAAESRPMAHKVLIFGDSTTGRLGERLNAWGQLNGFEVATVCWDGSTFQKWAESPNLPEIIEEFQPDAIFISLGANGLGVKDPEKKIREDYEKIKQTIGDIPTVWIGPPTWTDKTTGEILCEWMAETIGPTNYFRSFDLDLERTSRKNAHPSKAGSEVWMDTVIEWLELQGPFSLPDYQEPEEGEMIKSDFYIYKRMKEAF